MKYKMQFWNDWDAERAQDEFACTSVRMGSALAVDHPEDKHSEAIRILAFYSGHTDILTEYDLEQLERWVSG